MSRGCFETNISPHPFPRRMSYLYLTIMGSRVSYSTIHPRKQTNNIIPTYYKSRDGGKPLQLSSLCSRIHVEHYVQVGCCLFLSAMKPTIYYSGLPTSFCYHLRLQSHTTKAWLHKDLGIVTVDQNRADLEPLHPTCHSSPHNKNTDTSWSTAVTVVRNPNNQYNIY